MQTSNICVYETEVTHYVAIVHRKARPQTKNDFSDILARMALYQRDYAIAHCISAKKILVAHGS